MTRSRVAHPPLWLIVEQQNGWMWILAIDPGNGEVLPVFSFEEEARMFLQLGALETGWQARRTTAVELISLLSGPCAGVRKVALDPLPVADGMLYDLVSLSRERFVRNLTSKCKPLPSLLNPLRVSGAYSSRSLSETFWKKETWMQETREECQRKEGKTAVVRHRLLKKKIRDKDGPRGVYDTGIPDYVMLDFGSPEGACKDPSPPLTHAGPQRQTGGSRGAVRRSVRG